MQLKIQFAKLEEAPQEIRPLPIAHSTVATNFGNIAGSNRLIPSQCNFFNKAILYFYYGVPFYDNRQALSQNPLDAPIAIIFTPDALLEVDRLVPFDSGAAISGWFRTITSNLGEIDNYCLDNEGIATAPKLVHHLFGSNDAYLQGTFRNGNCASEILNAIVKLYATDLTGSGVDHRKYCIECQTFKDFDISKYIEWIGFPEGQIETFRKLLRWCYPKVPAFFAYESSRVIDSSAIAGMLRYKAKKFLRKYSEDLNIEKI